MQTPDLIDLIYRCLKPSADAKVAGIIGISIDGDRNSNEIILDVDDQDGRHSLIISSKAIHEIATEEVSDVEDLQSK